MILQNDLKPITANMRCNQLMFHSSYLDPSVINSTYLNYSAINSTFFGSLIINSTYPGIDESNSTFDVSCGKRLFGRFLSIQLISLGRLQINEVTIWPTPG